MRCEIGRLDFRKFIPVFYRPCQAFLIGISYGVCGVLVDLDHLVCFLIGRGVFDPETTQFGCRLWHSYIIPVSGACLCLGIALGIGSLVVFVQHAIRASFELDNPISISDKE